MPYVNRSYYCNYCNSCCDSYSEAEMCELKDRGIIDKLKEIVKLAEELNKDEERIKIGRYFDFNFEHSASITLSDVKKAEKENKVHFFKERKQLFINKEDSILLDRVYKEIEVGKLKEDMGHCMRIGMSLEDMDKENEDE